MSRPDLPSGSLLLKSATRNSALVGVMALAILLACVKALLDMTSAMWTTLFTTLGVYVVVAAPAIYLLEKRHLSAVARWLDDVTSSHEATARAFRQVMLFPFRTSFTAAALWIVSALLLAGVMQLLYRDWGAWEWVVICLAAVAESFAAAILLGFIAKVGEMGQVREALARAVGGPEERRALAPHVPLRVKLLGTVAGTTLVPVAFAALVALDQSGKGLERFALSWSAQVLADLPDEGGRAAVARAREDLDARELPIPMSLGLLEEQGRLLSPAIVEEVNARMAAGAASGNSRSLPSAAVFSWRRMGDGKVVVAAVPVSDLQRENSGTYAALGGLLVVSTVFALGICLFIAKEMASAIDVLRQSAERLAGGDLRPGRVLESEDELGELSRSFEEMANSLRSTIARVAEAADGIEAKVGSLSPVSRDLSAAAGDQVQGIQQAATSMEEINAQVAGIAQSSQSLNESVEESSSSILELGASGEELNETASLLSSKVEEVSSSIEEMVRSVAQVSENTEALSSAADETSASMEEMASSLREVDTSAAEAARLSNSVVERAEQGRSKVQETISGMEAIRESTETAANVIRGLHGRTVEIGAIVNVINDVADETNLLALNAAIIAAQAGEHGRAFGVVADEIKDLAERVLESTKEIGSLIHAVQEESRAARTAIDEGSDRVASGVDLSAEAGSALEEITGVSRQSGVRIGGIVTALREQAKAAGHVVKLMERVRSGVEQIRQATAEQDRGNVVVYQGSVTMREVAQQVRGTTEEQARGSGRIRESVEGVREAVERINAALQEQSQACAVAVEFLEAVQSRTGNNEEITRTVEGVSRDLLSQAENLREEVRRFRI